jgi:hypothetical protein
MPHNDCGAFVERPGDDSVDLLANDRARRVQKDIAREMLECILTHSPAMLVEGAQYGLHPLPI